MADFLEKKLQELLKESKLTQAQIAKKSDIKREYLNRILQGKLKNVTLKTLIKLANGFSVHPSMLIEGSKPLDTVITMNHTLNQENNQLKTLLFHIQEVLKKDDFGLPLDEFIDISISIVAKQCEHLSGTDRLNELYSNLIDFGAHFKFMYSGKATAFMKKEAGKEGETSTKIKI